MITDSIDSKKLKTATMKYVIIFGGMVVLGNEQQKQLSDPTGMSHGDSPSYFSHGSQAQTAFVLDRLDRCSARCFVCARTDSGNT